VPDSHPDCRWPLIQIAALQLLIARGEKIAYLQAVGYQDREKKTPMKVDAIFRLASMTKPIISVAAMMLVEEGKV
jgi:CubicO group peptidase (beta-lactamase class C family)